MRDTLYKGHSLVRGNNLRSANGSFELKMQSDGNLVIYRRDNNRPIWASNTHGSNGYKATMQSDGNFVIYTSNNHPVWASDTHGRRCDKLIIQNDGNLVIYDGSQATWASNSVTHGVISPEETARRKQAELDRQRTLTQTRTNDINRKWNDPNILVAVFEHVNYGGKYQMFGKGDYDVNHLSSINNDQISSIWVKPGAFLDLYEHGEFKGNSITYNSNANLSGFNDKTSSLRVGKKAVTIFEHVNFNGRSQSLEEGSYDLQQFTFGNDAISSIKVDANYYVEAFKNEKFAIGSVIYNKNIADLGAINDQISSIKVKRGAPPQSTTVVTVYEHNDYKGFSKTLNGGNYPNCKDILGNDVISSISIPTGYYAELFKDEEYGGDKIILSQNSPDLGKKAGINDFISSLKIIQGTAPTKTFLKLGETLIKGESLITDHCKLIMQEDGNLVLYKNNLATWASDTNEKGARAVMQEDGNFVVYGQYNEPLWASGTTGSNATAVRLSDLGVLKIVDSTNKTIKQLINPKYWMDTLDDKKTLKDICILGTHDAAIYELLTESGTSGFVSSLLHQNLMTETFKELSITQGKSLYEQLNGGVRYFDLRVKRLKLTGELVFYHGAARGPLLQVGLNDIKKFIDEVETETIILKFSHFNTFAPGALSKIAKKTGLVDDDGDITDIVKKTGLVDDDDITEADDKVHKELIKQINSTFTDKNRLAKNVTNSTELKDLRGKIIIMINGAGSNTVKEPRYNRLYKPEGIFNKMGDGIDIYDKYAENHKFEEMRVDQEKKFKGEIQGFSPSTQLFLLNWTLTGTTDYYKGPIRATKAVVGAIKAAIMGGDTGKMEEDFKEELNTPQSIKGFAEQINPQISNHIHKFLPNENSSRMVNIINVDFFEYGNTLDACLYINNNS